MAITMSSPKLNIIRNSQGKYYNLIDKVFVEQIVNSNWTRTAKEAHDLIDLFKLTDCEVIQLTEEEFTNEMATYTVKAVIVAQSLQEHLKQVNYHLPTISGVNKSLGVFLKNTIEKLSFITPYYKEFLKVKEDETDDVKANYDEFIYELSKLELYQTSELTAILKAYQKDSKSILGIAKKIINN